MVLDVLQITIDRKTGKEIEKKVVGQKVISDALFTEAFVKLYTGMSLTEFCEALRQDLYRQEHSGGEEKA